MGKYDAYLDQLAARLEGTRERQTSMKARLLLAKFINASNGKFALPVDYVRETSLALALDAPTLHRLGVVCLLCGKRHQHVTWYCQRFGSQRQLHREA